MFPPFTLVLDEIREVLSNSDYSELDSFIESIILSETVVCYGAGRVGLMMKCFAKRLKHLGKDAYFLEDSCVPKLGRKDLLIIGSGSGSTRSVLTIAEVAQKFNVPIVTVTASPTAAIPNMSSAKITLACNLGVDLIQNGVNSKQPMTSLFEQSLLVLIDSITLLLMEVLAETSSSMKERHNILE